MRSLPISFIPLSDKAFPLKSKILNYEARDRFLFRIMLYKIDIDLYGPNALFFSLKSVSFSSLMIKVLAKKFKELKK